MYSFFSLLGDLIAGACLLDYLALEVLGIPRAKHGPRVAAGSLFVLSVLVGPLDGHVVVFDDDELCQLVPLVHHGACRAMTVGREVLDGFVLVHGRRFTLDFGLQGVVVGFEAVAHLLQFGEEQIVAQIDHVADPVLHPVR